MNKQEQKTEHTKKNILDAAEQEFSEKGLYGCRVDAIAQRSGVNKALIYRHFGSKESLYEEVLERVYRRLGDMEDYVIHGQGDYVEKLREFVRLYFQFLYENPTFVRMVMWENLNGAKSFRERGMESIKDPIITELSKIVEKAKKSRKISSSVDGEQLILTLIACSFNYFSNMNTLNEIVHEDLIQKENIDKRIHATTDMLLAYMGIREKTRDADERSKFEGVGKKDN